LAAGAIYSQGKCVTKIGILSIKPSIEARSQPSFDRLYQMVGKNTGNLLFTNAVWNQIAGPKERTNFSFCPNKLNEEYSALVIPAANWLSPFVDFGDLAKLVEALKIPVVLIGLGAQDADYSGSIDVPQGTVRFIKAVSERSVSISVRGAYTRDILSSLGIDNVTVTGCPSLYQDFRTFSPPPQKLNIRFDRGLIHSTRYSASHAPFARTESAHRKLFRLAYAEKLDLLIQSEPEEMAMLTGFSDGGDFDDRLRMLMGEVYNTPDWEDLKAFILRQGRVYFDVSKWARSLDMYDYVLGTRLHGTIMALNSGVPAVLVHHDSRTRELCEFAAIPSVSDDSLQTNHHYIERLFARADWSRYYEMRERNLTTYMNFLSINGLSAA
jgi:hypothetical protein